VRRKSTIKGNDENVRRKSTIKEDEENVRKTSIRRTTPHKVPNS
jgi:hypothetical protein